MVAKENENISVAEIQGRRARRGIIALKLEKIPSLPRDVRKKKVLAIRCQLAKGKYDINRRLNAAIDKILKNLIK